MAENPFARIAPQTEEDLAETYHANTKYHPYLRSVEDAPAQPTQDHGPTDSLAYAAPEERLPLPLPGEGPDASLVALLRARRSRRDFTGAPARLDDLAFLLHAAYGVTGALHDGTPVRAAPSAGARYPLELFVLAQRVEGLAPGVYHYHPESHSLEAVERQDVGGRLDGWFFDQPFLAKGAFVVLVAAVFSRNMAKYKERGYRLILLEAGHAMQNLMLGAGAVGLGTCGLGGFLDDELNALVRLDGVDENVLYAVAVGSVPGT